MYTYKNICPPLLFHFDFIVYLHLFIFSGNTDGIFYSCPAE